MVALAWGPWKQHKHNSTHSSNFWKCLNDKWWPLTLPWSVEAQREPRRSTETCKGKAFQVTQTVPFCSSDAPVAPESPVTCERGQLDTHHFLRSPNDPSRRTLTVAVLPAALALMLETGLSRPEELFRCYAIKKPTIAPLFSCLLGFKTLKHLDQLCKLSYAVFAQETPCWKIKDMLVEEEWRR